MAVASKVLMAFSVPVSVTLVLLLPASVTPAPVSSVKVPLVMTSVTVRLGLPSTSLTLRPVMTLSLSSVAGVCAGKVLTGASLTPVMLTVRVLALTLVLTPPLSVPPLSCTLKPKLA